MAAKLNLPLFDVGFELEFFLVNPEKPWIVLNASKELSEKLGFGINQNVYGDGSLNLGNGYDLVTDGTVAELRWFRNYNNGNLPITDYYKPLQALKILEGFQRSYWPFLENGRKGFIYGKKTVFNSPGKVFSSNKHMWNAYTAEHGVNYKKNKEGDVTFRTAGFHLHFSVNHAATMDRHTFKRLDIDLDNFIFTPQYRTNELNLYIHTNELVKILDEVYDAVVVNSHDNVFGAESKERVERYAKRGDYRIRNKSITKSGLHTLEYRQLDAMVANGGSLAMVQKLINIFQFKAKEYLESVL